MAKRSPILGYNHNIRYRGLVFHIQTEDSGVDNPHIFTHLFRGGVILSTRKLNYDPESSEDTAKGLMQAQHKAVMKGLKRGEFDDKIDSYLGNEPGLEPRASTAELDERGRSSTDDLIEPPSGEQERAPQHDVSAAIEAISDELSEPVQVHSPAPPPPPPVGNPTRAGQYSQHRKSSTRIQALRPDEVPTQPVQRQPPPKTTPPPRTIAKPETRRPARPASGGVVVSRPAVIVGAPPKVVGQQQPGKQTQRVARKAREETDGIFGQDLISEKSLDEVILAYLSEDGSEE